MYPYKKLHLLQKATEQLQKLFKSGRFQRLNAKKRQQWQRKILQLTQQISHLSHLQNVKKVIAASSVALSLFYGNVANAQSFASSVEITSDWNIRNIHLFADIDNDGDLDAFDDYRNIYINSGTVNVERFSGEKNDAIKDTEGSIWDLVDIDNDGDLDLFEGKTGRTHLFYENTGTPNEPIFTFRNITSLGLPNNTDYMSSMRFEDMDNDGDFDILAIKRNPISNQDDIFVYYENTGTPNQANFIEAVENPFNLNQSSLYEAKLTIVDFDNDGDVDIVTAEYRKGVTFFENIGTPSTPSFVVKEQRLRESRDYLNTIATADMDNDGDFDVFTSSSFNGGYGYYYSVSFIENTLIDTIGKPNTRPFSGISTVQILEKETYHFKESDFDFFDADSITLFHHIQIKTCPRRGAFLFKGKELKFNDIIYMNEINELTYQYNQGERIEQFTFMMSDGEEYNKGVRSKCIIKVVEAPYQAGTSLKIFPNPAEAITATFRIKSAIEKTATLVIQDAMGKIINQIGLNLPEGEVNVPIDIPHLQKGIYFVTIRTDEGVILTEKLMVQ